MMGTRTPAQLILASASPRRQELLQQIGVSFEVCPVDIDESPLDDESPATYVERMAMEKARAGWEASDRSLPVLGSDTAVVIDGQVLGKPRDRAHGLEMLHGLSGREHLVMTSVAMVRDNETAIRLSESRVIFSDIPYDERVRYWESGEPADKAGGYAIQGRAAAFIQRLEGSFSGVMGLPLYESSELLNQFGIDVTQNWAKQQNLDEQP
jgi:septum formation protein